MPAPRSLPQVLEELAAVERHLVDAPPHSGAGQRDDLARRRDALRRELEALRRQRTGPADGSAGSDETG